MRKIEHTCEINDDVFERLIESIKSELQNGCKMSEVKTLNLIVVTLAFKYWQENASQETGFATESFDSDYVLLHWQQFCDSEIGRSIEVLSRDDYDEDVVATCLGLLSEYITRHNFDSVNAQVIRRWQKRHRKALSRAKLIAKVSKLIQIYGRGTFAEQTLLCCTGLSFVKDKA